MAAEEEHCLIQTVLYVKYSTVHISYEFPQTNCGFSGNIRNNYANLTKIYLNTKIFAGFTIH